MSPKCASYCSSGSIPTYGGRGPNSSRDTHSPGTPPFQPSNVKGMKLASFLPHFLPQERIAAQCFFRDFKATPSGYRGITSLVRFRQFIQRVRACISSCLSPVLVCDVASRWGRVASMAPAANGRGPPDFNFLSASADPLALPLCPNLSLSLSSWPGSF